MSGEMSVQEGKRIRKPIFYQEEDDGDDDFADFTPPTKKLKSDQESSSDHSQSSKSKNESNVKDKKERRDEKERRHKEKKEKKKEKDRDRSREREKSRDKHESKKDRDERRERSKDRHSSRDKDKERHRDRERRKDRDDRREKNKDQEAKTEKSKEQEVKTERSKEQEVKTERSKEQEDKTERGKDQEVETERSKEQEVETERSKEQEVETESSKAQDNSNEDSQKKSSSEKVKEEKRSEKGDTNKCDVNSAAMTSTQQTPTRSNPKPRLTVEERRFQRELEAALAISKIETGSSPPSSNGVQGEVKAKEGECDIKSSDHTSFSSEADGEIQQEAPQDHNSVEVEKPLPTKEEELSNTDNSGQLLVTSGVIKQKETVEKKKPEKTKEAKIVKEEPLPGTSWGLTSKRQRKTVVFKEESDSDSFDGFDDAGSDFSEGSDFSPSPKKKKGKEKKEKPAKKTAPKTSVEAKTKDKGPRVEPPILKALLAASDSQATRKPVSTTKENKAPSLPPVASKVKPPSVTSKPKPSVNSNKSANNPMRTKPSPMDVNREITDSSSSTTSARKSIGLVRAPFRSPVLQSSGNSSSKLETSPSSGRAIGLRLGLSRRSSFKPLHPNLNGNK